MKKTQLRADATLSHKDLDPASGSSCLSGRSVDWIITIYGLCFHFSFKDKSYFQLGTTERRSSTELMSLLGSAMMVPSTSYTM